MPAPNVVNDFLECVRKSGVVEPKRLDEYLAGLGDDAPATPAGMADALVRDGLLTRFQADQLLRGRWRNFILCGKYTILEPLGAGGMGTVYLCSHKIMRRPVAVKVLPAAQADDPGSVDRFHREAQAVAQLRHPNIVGAHDVDKDGKFHFLVMEYVDGVSLQELVKRSGPLDPIRAAHYMHQAALGLEHAHEAGLVHRDVKPANLLVDRAGVVKILDLGLARFFKDTKESVTQKYDNNVVLGTADYLAPEQAVDSHNVDIRCDIYSLGITFYFLLSGRSPFQEGSVAEKLIWHQVRRPTPIRELRPETPPGLAEVLDKMIAKEPAHRYQTPAELAEALAPWTQTPIDPPTAEELPPITPGGRLADINYVLPRTPSPSTPTPSPAKPASSGGHRLEAPQRHVNTHLDAHTAMIPSTPITMKSVRQALPARAEFPAASDRNRLPAAPVPVADRRRGRRRRSGVGRRRPRGCSEPAPPDARRRRPAAERSTAESRDEPARPDSGACAGVSLVRNDDGVRVKTAKYEAAIGADGCLTSFTVGGVEFLRPGEPLFKGKTVARGAYFYYEKPPHQGAVQMPTIELPQGQGNVVKASGDKFSVTYEFTPDAVHLKASNATDDPAPFFVVLDSVPVAEVVNGAGERLTVPTVALPDAKWATTTWKAGRNTLTIRRTNGGDVKLWGPFGQARSQVWEGDVASYGAADILLEPSVVTDEKPAVPPGGVLVTRQGGARRVCTDLYEAVVDRDGCVPSLRVDGVEFFKFGVSISRGAYFHQQGVPQLLPDMVQIGPAVLVASGKNAGIFYAFGPDKLTWALENRTDAAMAFFIVFDPTVIAVRNAKNEWLKAPVGDYNAPPDPKWAKTTWYAGRAKITITGGSRVWGPWPDAKGYQVWEASLDPKEKRTVVIETALATPDEAKQAAAVAGTAPPTIAELSVYAPLDYQVVQRTTREHGEVPINGRVRPDFDRLEARVTGKAMDDAPTGQWQACRRPPERTRLT